MKNINYSIKWKNWKSIVDINTCLICRNNNGKIYDINEFISPSPPVHPHCRCIIQRLKTLSAGTATVDGTYGADWFLKYYGILPDYYITLIEAEELGYRSYLGNLNIVAPGMMITKGVYKNKNGHLPESPGRI